MIKGIKKYHSDAFKLKVALTAIKNDKTVAELCSELGVAAGQIYAWKKQLEEEGAQIFADKRKKNDQKGEVDRLHKLIGKIAAERDFLHHVLDR